MRCIFCKAPSDSSISVEHIIPESLGNQDHVLPQGWVCDQCNNYLSRKVEAPFMNSEYGKRARFEMEIPSRRRRIPIVSGFHPQSMTKVEFLRDKTGLSFFAADGEDEPRFVNTLKTRSSGSLWIPSSGDPHLDYETARFIGMIALEILAYRCMEVNGWNTEVACKPELDELRDYVRRGRPGFVWPVHMRRIYPAEHQFSDEIDPEFQVLHEFNILFIPSAESAHSGEYYAVIAILGIEYVINLGGPELDGYLGWLLEHNDESYLYGKPEKNKLSQINALPAIGRKSK